MKRNLHLAILMTLAALAALPAVAQSAPPEQSSPLLGLVETDAGFLWALLVPFESAPVVPVLLGPAPWQPGGPSVLPGGPVPQAMVCDPYGQGFWRRQCAGIGAYDRGRSDRPSAHPAFPVPYLQALLAAADAYLVPFVGQTACEALDPEPSSEICERALSQCGAMLLNIVSGQLDTACPADLTGVSLPPGYPPPATVGEALMILQVLQPPPTDDDCRMAHDLCAALNG